MNDMNEATTITKPQDVLAGLMSRQSALPLSEPAPNATQLEAIFDTAMRAPDHGALRPWRFLLIQGDARQALGEVFVDIASAKAPGEPRDAHRKRASRAMRAPLIIAVAASLVREHKVPEFEQLLAVGAATMNILNAIHLLGFAAFWASGPDSRDPLLHRALGLTDEMQCLGFLYVGTAPTKSTDERPAKRPAGMTFVSEWSGR